MKANLDFVKDRFERFNKEIFNGQIPIVPIRISHARTFLGRVTYRKERHFFKTNYTSFCLVISDSLDLAEEELEDIVLHEMIHLYILSNKLYDTSSHGQTFRSMMKDINEKYGRHISITHRSTEEQKCQDQRLQQHLVLVAELNNGTYISVVHPQYKQKLERVLNYTGIVQSHWWIQSQSTLFNRYPKSRTLKLYKMTPEILKEISRYHI